MQRAEAVHHRIGVGERAKKQHGHGIEDKECERRQAPPTTASGPRLQCGRVRRPSGRHGMRICAVTTLPLVSVRSLGERQLCLAYCLADIIRDRRSARTRAADDCPHAHQGSALLQRRPGPKSPPSFARCVCHALQAVQGLHPTSASAASGKASHACNRWPGTRKPRRT